MTSSSPWVTTIPGRRSTRAGTPSGSKVGPYLVEGEMPTFPGFDPGRALTRPTGDFVLLRDVRVGPRDSPDPLASSDTVGQHALVNRYGVESVACDLMLGFFFPGAAMIQADVAEAGAT
jgi:hypothetical protein